MIRGMNSGLHRLSTIRGEVNTSANDEALKFSFIIPTSGTFKDSWLGFTAPEYYSLRFLCLLKSRLFATSFLPAHNVIDLNF